MREATTVLLSLDASNALFCTSAQPPPQRLYHARRGFTRALVQLFVQFNVHPVAFALGMEPCCLVLLEAFLMGALEQLVVTPVLKAFSVIFPCSSLQLDVYDNNIKLRLLVFTLSACGGIYVMFNS